MDVVTLGQAKAALGLKARRAAFSFGTTSASSTTTLAEWHQRTAVRLPVNTTRWRIHFRNADYRSGGAATTGVLTCTQGVFKGLAAKNADGTFTASNYAAAPTNPIPGFTTASDGSEYVTPWVTDANDQFTAHRDYLIGWGFTAPGGQSVQRSTGGQSWFSSGAGSASLANLSSQNLTLGSVALCVLDAWIEYEFIGTNKIGLFVGDSLTEGYLATYGQRDNFPNQFSQRSKMPAVALAASGAQTTHFMNNWDTKWSKYAGITPDFVVVSLGSNDLNAGTALATIQSQYGSVVASIRTTYGASIPIYVCTVMPRMMASAYEANRLLLNTWLRKSPFGVHGCFSFDKAVQDDPARAVVDGATTSASATVTSATAVFSATDVGRPIQGAGIPFPSFIGVVNSATSVGLSSTQGTNTAVNATATATGVTLTIGGQVSANPELVQTDFTHLTTGGYSRMADALGSIRHTA